MAIYHDVTLGTFLGYPVQKWDGQSDPIIGDIVENHSTLETMVYDGSDWYLLDSTDMPNSMLWLEKNRPSKKHITDEFLEKKYPELKQLKEEYEKMRDELKVFEILKINEY